MVGPDLRVLQVNAAFERLLGGSRVELLGRPLADRLGTPATRDRIGDSLARTLAGTEPEARLAVACTVRGGERELELRLGALAPVPGRVDALLIEAQRVDDRGQPQPSNGESWLSAVMNSVADGIVLLDPEGTITWLSRSAETIFDYPRDAAIGAVDRPAPASAGGTGRERAGTSAGARIGPGARWSSRFAAAPANWCRSRSRAASSSSATGG